MVCSCLEAAEGAERTAKPQSNGVTEIERRADGSTGVAKRRFAIGSIAKNEHLSIHQVLVFHDRSDRASRPAAQAGPSNLTFFSA